MLSSKERWQRLVGEALVSTRTCISRQKTKAAAITLESLSKATVRFGHSNSHDLQGKPGKVGFAIEI